MHDVTAWLTWVYRVVCAALTILGLYRVALLAAYLRARRLDGGPADAPPPSPREWPHVTVQLPVYNERYVVRRLLEAAARLDYPRDRLEVQVLDDSTDRTSVLIRRLVRVMRRSGLDVRHLRRPHRAGYKAGALAAGLRVARGELIAIFDADFVPPPDFLRRMVPHVLRPGVGVVQARWSHLNRDDSWFTRLQAVLLDGHFAIEQPARAASGCLLSFNGTGGVWRREAITSAGGWSSDTLTEDLDLSLRAQLCGWRVTYRADVLVPGELPRDPNSFRTQQRRWTKGGVQVARKLLPAILRSGLRPLAKLEILLRFSSYAGYPLLIALALLRAPLRALVPRQGFIDLLPGEPVLLGFGTLPLVVFYVLAQRGAGAPGHFRRWLGQGLGAMALGAGLAVGNTLAVLGGLFDRDLRFERTPKLGGARRILPSAPYRAGGTRTAALEIALLTVLVAGKFLGTATMWLGEIPFLAFFGFGLILLAAPSLRRGPVGPSFGATHPLLDAPREGGVNRAAARAFACALVPFAAMLGLAIVRGPWTRDLGPFLLLFALAFWACIRAARLPLDRRTILLGAVVFRTLFVLLPPMLSDDIYRYVWEGRVQNAGFDPYVLAPNAPQLAALRDADWARINHPEYTAIYPPLAQLVFRLLAALGGVTWFKAAFCLVDLALVALLVRTLERRGEPPSRAVLYAWNPLAVVEVASSGHLEPLGVLPLVAAVVWASRPENPNPSSRSRSARLAFATGAALAASVAVKYGAAFVAPLWGRRLGWRGWIAFTVVVVALAAAYLPAGHHLFDSLQAYAEHWRYNELGFALIARVVADPHRARTVAFGIALVGLVLVARRRAPLERRVLGALAIALAFSPTLHAWYLLWPLALVPLASNAAILAWSGTIALAYLYSHPAFGLGPVASTAGSWWLRLVEILPVAAAAGWARRRA